ncbi:MAG: hypothetical protein R3192_09555, partial [Woeseiaceae bacterium]|nr:hypothetical protein [Woeseiaceae bacterium]
MSRWLFNRKYIHDTRRLVRDSVFATLSLYMLAGDAGAQTSQADWTTETRLYLSGITSYWASDAVAVTHDALAASAELRFGTDARPWSVSLFSEYRYSSHDRYSDQFNLGTFIDLDWPRWDARVFVFINKAPRANATWMYAGRLRYRFAEHHK